MHSPIVEKKSKLIKVSLSLFSVLLPAVFVFPILKENLCTILMMLICANTIFYSILTQNYKQLNSKIFLLTIPFWIIVLRSFFTNDLKESANHVQHALFFLIIPLFFSLIPSDFFERRKINLYFSILKNICLLILIIYIASFLINVPAWKYDVVFNNGSFFRDYIYYDFKLFVIHPTYYTTILILCSAHSLDLILKEKKYFQFIYLVLFVFISFMLLARLNIVLLFITLFTIVLYRNQWNVKQRILFIAATILFMASLTFVIPGVKGRFVELYHSFNQKPEDINYDSTNIRKAIFDSSVELAKDNWLFGVGFENLQNRLDGLYKQNYNSSFYTNQHYMTHNYYFYIFLSAGILGLLVYLFYLLNIIKICLKSKVFLFSVFLINVLIVCFTEDFFYRQYGIMYFNLFLMCFIRYSENLEKEKIQLINRA